MCIFKSTGLEDKATACQMLVCYARELKEHFVDYAEPTVKLMVPMLKFYFHDGVRSAATESLPCLLQCAQIRGPQYVQEMWAYICPELLKVRHCFGVACVWIEAWTGWKSNACDNTPPHGIKGPPADRFALAP